MTAVPYRNSLMKLNYEAIPASCFGYNRETRVWEVIDTDAPMSMLFQKYVHLEFGIVDNVDPKLKEYTFKPKDYYGELYNYAGTINDWFLLKAGTTIGPLVEDAPILKFANAHYQALDYSVIPKTHMCPPNVHFTQDFAMEDASDIVIELDKEHRPLYLDTALYNIGGMWVRHQAVSEGVRLPNAATIAKRCGEVSPGMWAFNDIGKVTTAPITEDMLFKLDVTRDWYSNILIKSPVELFGKSVALVIGGCLMWIDQKSIYSDGAMNISLSNLNLLDRLLITRDYFDWDDIGLGDFGAGASVSLIRNPETLKALLLHFSSFLVFIDNPYLEFEERGVDATGPVGKFYLVDKEGEKPLGMLKHSSGRAIHYWPIWEDGEWFLHTSEKQTPNYVYGTSRWHIHGKVNDAKTHLEPWSKPDVRMIQVKARVK